MWLTTIYYAVLIYVFKLRRVRHSKKIAAAIAVVAAIVFIINIYGSFDKNLKLFFSMSDKAIVFYSKCRW